VVYVRDRIASSTEGYPRWHCNIGRFLLPNAGVGEEVEWKAPPQPGVCILSLYANDSPTYPDGVLNALHRDDDEGRIGRIEIIVYNINVNSIWFNHTAGDAEDGITLNYASGNPVATPEWIYGWRNSPVAYKATITPKIKAKFSVSPAGKVVSANIYAELERSGIGLGAIAEMPVSFDAQGNSEWVTFDFDGEVSDYVKKGTFSLKWKAYDVNEFTTPDVECGTTNHVAYVVLDTPQHPMEEPWTGVLDRACAWARGVSDCTSAVEKVTDNVYHSGYEYDSLGGAAQYFDGGLFDLTRSLQEWGSSSKDINCWDCANMVDIFGNSIGCTLSRYFIYLEPSGFLVNYIKPIARTWTNDPFSYGTPRSAFLCHYTAWNGTVYDACLELDGDSDPTSSPHVGILPKGMCYYEYRRTLVDPLCVSDLTGIEQSTIDVK